MRSMFLCCLTFFTSCVHSKEISFTGSTPAGEVVRTFLNISLSDSIDFIRWKLTMDNKNYRLNCIYGIGKPNTNGFIGGGSKVALNGEISEQQLFYTLEKNGKKLKLFRLNGNLHHFAGDNGKLLVGNAGWSYTLNSLSPTDDKATNILFKIPAIKDSIIIEGRTPCGVPGILTPETSCYKLKWKFVLYAGDNSVTPATYKLYGTAWREKGVKTGRWKIEQGRNGRLIYQLNHENDQPFVLLLKVDENIFMILDETEKPLIGDEDFSYTLNRRL